MTLSDQKPSAAGLFLGQKRVEHLYPCHFLLIAIMKLFKAVNKCCGDTLLLWMGGQGHLTTSTPRAFSPQLIHTPKGILEDFFAVFCLYVFLSGLLI